MDCRHCGAPIRATDDPNMPYVHQDTGNTYCEVSTPASAVELATFNPTGMRQEATPRGSLLTLVGELRPGDLVDLAGDQYAERECSPGCESCELAVSTFAYELATVLAVDHETPECVRVDFEGLSVGFPPDHQLLRLAMRTVDV